MNMLKFAFILAVVADEKVLGKARLLLYSRPKYSKPFSTILNTACCAHAENRYYLYTRNNPFEPELITGRGALPAGSNFNIRHDTIILIHGHGENPRSSFNVLIKHDISRLQEPYNVLVVDWEAYAMLSYSIASSNVPLVANSLANLIKALTQLTPPLDVSRLHLVGFGLGAHVAGIASRGLHGIPGIAARITGLDPSGRGWGTNSLRLRHDDAHYVEVIHTDGSGLRANGIGTPIGQINFYANGGSNQPGCFSHSCSHNRAYELFAASMFNWNLVGYPCSSTLQLNLNTCRGSSLKIGGTELHKRGQSYIYRINTRRQYPF